MLIEPNRILLSAAEVLTAVAKLLLRLKDHHLAIVAGAPLILLEGIMTGVRIRITTSLHLSAISKKIRDLSDGIHPKSAQYTVEIKSEGFIFKQRRIISRNPPPEFEGVIKESTDECTIDGVFRAGIFDSIALLFSIVWLLVACMIWILVVFLPKEMFSFQIGLASVMIGVTTTALLVRINSQKNKVFFDALVTDLRRIFANDTLNHDT